MWHDSEDRLSKAVERFEEGAVEAARIMLRNLDRRGVISPRIDLYLGHCHLEAEEYRGPGPMTPFIEDVMNADPNFARSWQSEGHGDHHIQCHYEVRLASQPQARYRWRTVHGNTLGEHGPEVCLQRLDAVVDDIIRTTKECTQLDAGAYWGDVLEPM